MTILAITGVFGQLGASLCETPFSAGHRLRLVVHRDDAHAEAWRSRGAEVCVTDLGGTAHLANAFRCVGGADLMNPPAYVHHDLFAKGREVQSSMIVVEEDATVPHEVALALVCAHQAADTGDILTTRDIKHLLQRFRGKTHHFSVSAHMLLLLRVFRYLAGLFGATFDSGIALSGAFIVYVDRQPARSFVFLMRSASGGYSRIDAIGATLAAQKVQHV